MTENEVQDVTESVVTTSSFDIEFYAGGRWLPHAHKGLPGSHSFEVWKAYVAYLNATQMDRSPDARVTYRLTRCDVTTTKRTVVLDD